MNDAEFGPISLKPGGTRCRLQGEFRGRGFQPEAPEVSGTGTDADIPDDIRKAKQAVQSGHLETRQ
jgi:hypothetical protein